MKGVIELNWKVLLIIIASIAAFLIILLFTTGLSDEIVNFFKNITIRDLVELWKKITQRNQG
ncbi:MAG: hypothetical protein ABIM21_04070 [candidate division WOR-3 bacterium]